MSDSEKIRLELDLGQSAADADKLAKAVEEIGDKAHGAAKGTEALDKATEKLGKASGVSSRAMLELGRGVQDFASGGLLGISNNVEGLATSLGLGAGVAGTATLAVVALQLLTPQISKLFDALGGGDKEAEDAAAAIASLTEANEKLKKTLSELKGAHDARAGALGRENQALERSIELEKQRAKNAQQAYDEETKRRKGALAGEGEPSAEEKARQGPEKRRAAELQKILGGPDKAMINKLLGDEAVGKSGDVAKDREQVAALERERAGIQPWEHNAGGRIAAAEGAIKRARAVQAAHERQAREGALGEAQRVYQGSPEALEHLLGLMPQSALRTHLEQLTPASERAQTLRDMGGTVRGFMHRVDEKTMQEAHQRAEAERRRHDAQAEAERRRHDAQRGQRQQQQTEAALHGHAQQAHAQHVERAAHAREQSASIEAAMSARGVHQRAAQEAAMMREQGGYVGDKGRFVRTGRAGQEARLAELIRREMAGAGPPMLLGAHAGTAAMRAGQAVDHQVALNQQLMNNQGAMAANHSALHGQLRQARAIGQRADRQAQQLQQPLANGGW